MDTDGDGVLDIRLSSGTRRFGSSTVMVNIPPDSLFADLVLTWLPYTYMYDQYPTALFSARVNRLLADLLLILLIFSLGQ